MSPAGHGPYANNGPSYAAHFQRLHTMERCTRTIDRCTQTTGRCTQTVDRCTRTTARCTQRIFIVSIQRDVARGQPAIVRRQRNVARRQWTVVRGRRSVVRGAFLSSPYNGPMYADNVLSYADDASLYADNTPSYGAHFHRPHTTGRWTRTRDRCTRRISIVSRQPAVVRSAVPSSRDAGDLPGHVHSMMS